MKEKSVEVQVAARRSLTLSDAPPEEGGYVKEESIEVQAVREYIAKVVQAREDHALVVIQKETAERELNEAAARLAAAQSRVAAREKEIALTGGELPLEPFPEDAEMGRLSRHIRIRREGVRDWEDRVRASQAGLTALIGEMEESWGALGAATSARLLKEFRDAATALLDAHLAYRSLAHHFLRSWSSAMWKHWDQKLALGDPMTGAFIVDPLRGQIASRWPAAVQTLAEDVRALRAEVDGAKAGAPVRESAAVEREDVA